MKSPLFMYFKVCYADGTSPITTKQTLINAVGKRYITDGEYREITGEDYNAQ